MARARLGQRRWAGLAGLAGRDTERQQAVRPARALYSARLVRALRTPCVRHRTGATATRAQRVAAGDITGTRECCMHPSVCRKVTNKVASPTRRHAYHFVAPCPAIVFCPVGALVTNPKCPWQFRVGHQWQRTNAARGETS